MKIVIYKLDIGYMLQYPEQDPPDPRLRLTTEEGFREIEPLMKKLRELL